jgi:hypothetical protein
MPSNRRNRKGNRFGGRSAARGCEAGTGGGYGELEYDSIVRDPIGKYFQLPVRRKQPFDSYETDILRWPSGGAANTVVKSRLSSAEISRYRLTAAC